MMEENVTFNASEEAVEAEMPVESVASETAEGSVSVNKKKRKPINQQKLQDNLWGWIFCIPLIVGTVWFVYAALIMAILLSFTDYSIGNTTPLFEYLFTMKDHIAHRTGVTGQGWDIAGTTDALYWYKFIFTRRITAAGGLYSYHEMGFYLFNTVFYMIGIPIGMILAVFFAVCMSRDIKGGNVFRVLYYLPCVASSISVVYTFKILFDPLGVINQMLGLGQFKWMDAGATTPLTWGGMLHSSKMSSCRFGRGSAVRSSCTLQVFRA